MIDLDFMETLPDNSTLEISLNTTDCNCNDHGNSFSSGILAGMAISTSVFIVLFLYFILPNIPNKKSALNKDDSEV